MIAEQSVMAFKYVVLITSLNDGEENEAAYKTERRFLAGLERNKRIKKRSKPTNVLG